MNIEIITIISYNYGNRLQNYALQTYLEKLGCTVVTSRLDTREEPLYENHFREWRVVTDADTMKLYRKFDDNIHWKADLLSYKKDDPSIDYYVAGSDQLWNPIFNFGSDREFLRFTKPEKRIAYAASIGIKELPLESIDNFRNGFEGIENITMRENAGADIVETLTKKRPGVVLDPTMLLDDKDWDKIAESSNVKLDENFVVKYILGIHNPELDTMVDDYAREHGCKVIDLIADMADENGVAVAIHMAESPIACMAAVHAAAAMHNVLAMELHSVDIPWWQNMVNGLPKPLVVNGYIKVPNTPGLGIESLNEELLAEHINPNIPGLWEPTDEWNKEFSNDRIWS